jgi:hypothetical protein
MADDPEPIGNQYFESVVDKQIREAQERGEFDGLPGFGKPLPNLDQPYDEMWWVRDFAKREKLSLLPPTLALRKDAEDAHAAALEARSERLVRKIITEINIRIVEAQTTTTVEVPTLNLLPFDVEDVVREWREEHPDALPPDKPSMTRPDPSADRAGQKTRPLASMWRRVRHRP